MISKSRSSNRNKSSDKPESLHELAQVKPLLPADVPGVRWLACHQSFGRSAPQIEAPPASGDAVAWIAEADERIAGFVFGWESFGKVAHICQIRVHKQYHGRDIDRRLAQAALQSAREHGCLKVVLHNFSASEWAIELVEEAGFVFNRSRNLKGDACLEFYLDLYGRPTVTIEPSQNNEITAAR